MMMRETEMTLVKASTKSCPDYVRWYYTVAVKTSSPRLRLLVVGIRLMNLSKFASGCCGAFMMTLRRKVFHIDILGTSELSHPVRIG